MTIQEEMAHRVDSFLTELTLLSHKWGIGINVSTSDEDPRPTLFLLEDEDKGSEYYIDQNDGVYFG